MWKKWKYTALTFLVYILTFILWYRHPHHLSVLYIGLISLTIVSLFIYFSINEKYFINKTDRNCHIIVALDLFLETFSYEIRSILEYFDLIDKNRTHLLHKNFNFLICVIELGSIIILFRFIEFRKLSKKVK